MPLREYESRSFGREVKLETRTTPLKGRRRFVRVQRWVMAVATAVPRDWPKRIMLDGWM